MKATGTQATGGASRTRRRAAESERPAPQGGPPRVGGRGGTRLARAFEAVEGFPVLAEARTRALDLASRRNGSAAGLATEIESDVGLTVVVLRAANRHRGKRGIGSVPGAVESLESAELVRAMEAATAYDFLDRQGPWGPLPETIRRHAVATRIAAERIGELANLPARDELATAALLHDIGRLVLVCLYANYSELTADPGLLPEERLRLERRELGIDHALVGGVLARRIGVPPSVASAIERHHAADAQGSDAAVGLADLVAHHAHGEPVSADPCRVRARALGIKPADLRGLLYQYPYAPSERPHASEPCPLSDRELDALRGLAEGKVYKEIAEEMGLSASTVRTHLHNVYRKVGAPDRAQAVLVARDRGWI